MAVRHRTDAWTAREVREPFRGFVHPDGVEPGAVTDVELGTRARSGDVQAVAGLLERHRPSLYAAAVRLLGNRADALDAVQDTSVVALVRLTDLRDPAAVKRWLHTVLRNVCLMRLRQRREVPSEYVELAATVPSPEEVLEQHVLRDWVWQAIDALSADERLTVMLRYFTRCTSYDAIARITSAPVGTVRSRLNRARARLADSLLATVAGTSMSRDRVEANRRVQWADFYRTLHERPVATTYRDLFAADVNVRDTVGHWFGVRDWSAHEREAIELGVRASLLGVLASDNTAVLEIDFTNPDKWPDHCPRHATFVHHLHDGRSTRLRIHYPDHHPDASTAAHA
jgi:RNA polymerase sigma-70 factor (ECF subfamily)